MTGVFQVSRSVWDHPIFKREKFTEREAWLWLLSEAAWCDKRVRVGRCVVELKRGQIAHARSYLAAKWQWNESAVRRFLERLENDAMIDRLATSETTILTICNYDDYQFGWPARDRQTDRPATGPRPQEEELKKLKNDDDDEGARPKLVSDDSFSIATEIGALCGFSEPLEWPPGWAGAPMRVQAWLNGGWHRDHIIGGVREAMAKKRDGPPHSINYFDKPIASFVGKQLAPLPEVRIQERETINVIRDAKADAKSEFRAAHAGLRQFVARNRSREGGEVVRLLQPPGDRGRSDISGGSG